MEYERIALFKKSGIASRQADLPKLAIDDLTTYKVKDCDGLYLSAEEVKRILGEEKWKELLPGLDVNMVRRSDARLVAEAAAVQKRIAIMSHLSDVQDAGSAMSDWERRARINLVKRLVLDDRPMSERITEQELNRLFLEGGRP